MNERKCIFTVIKPAHLTSYYKMTERKYSCEKRLKLIARAQ